MLSNIESSDCGANKHARFVTQDTVAAAVTQQNTAPFSTQDTLVSMRPIETGSLESDPAGFLATLYQKVKQKISTWLGVAPPTVQAKPSMTKQWLEEEIAKLRQEIETEEVHIDRFIQRLSLLAGLSFFHQPNGDRRGTLPSRRPASHDERIPRTF